MRGTLAVENTRRNPRRTAATAATLMIGLSICAAVTVPITSVAAKDAAATETGDKADIQVTAIPFADLNSGTAADLAKVPGVQAVTPITPVSIKLGERKALGVTAVDPGSIKDLLPLSVMEGSLDGLADGIAVSTVTAGEYDLRIGSEVSGPVQVLGAAGQPVSLPVVAIYDVPESVDQKALKWRSVFSRPCGRPGQPLARRS
jgi:putative ABC transport system permease protein